MAEVAPRESITSLTTTTPEKRKACKKTILEMESLEEEESLSCLKWPANAVMAKENEYLRCLESASNLAMERITEDCETQRLCNENEEKPNFKRRQNSLDGNIVDGERSLKKLKISSEPQSEKVTD